jgi:hypothetical protein
LALEGLIACYVGNWVGIGAMPCVQLALHIVAFGQLLCDPNSAMRYLFGHYRVPVNTVARYKLGRAEIYLSPIKHNLSSVTLASFASAA